MIEKIIAIFNCNDERALPVKNNTQNGKITGKKRRVLNFKIPFLGLFFLMIKAYNNMNRNVPKNPKSYTNLAMLPWKLLAWYPNILKIRAFLSALTLCDP